jgi:hypothetical protein
VKDWRGVLARIDPRTLPPDFQSELRHLKRQSTDTDTCMSAT